MGRQNPSGVKNDWFNPILKTNLLYLKARNGTLHKITVGSLPGVWGKKLTKFLKCDKLYVAFRESQTIAMKQSKGGKEGNHCSPHSGLRKAKLFRVRG